MIYGLSKYTKHTFQIMLLFFKGQTVSLQHEINAYTALTQIGRMNLQEQNDCKQLQTAVGGA